MGTNVHPSVEFANGRDVNPELDTGTVVVSIVMPCLNEEETIGACVEKALEGIKRTGLPGEVIVSDNGSEDRSIEIAETLGARVIHAPKRGYGNAYLAGFAAARGEYIVMGDSDDTYDFREVGSLIKPLQEDGAEYVMGSRFAGTILPGAMPWLHQYIGNPVLTKVLNVMFGLKASDCHTGYRAFTREAYEKMRLRTTGMEFASEMVINAAKAKLKVAEVPIIYYPRGGESKLRSFRDGWRHLRFMLMYSPDHLFLIPGGILFFLGFVGMVALLPGPVSLGRPHFRLPLHVPSVSPDVAGISSVDDRLLREGVCLHASLRSGRPHDTAFLSILLSRKVDFVRAGHLCYRTCLRRLYPRDLDPAWL